MLAANATGVVDAPPGTDVWNEHAAGRWLVIPTNRQRRGDGSAVMGAGIALSAARKFPDLPARYGRALAAGVQRIAFADLRLLLAPTKDHWRNPAVPALVTALLDATGTWLAAHPDSTVVMPAIGAGLGGLPWPDVRAEVHRRLAGKPVLLVPPRT